MKDIFRGELVRFTAEDPETIAKLEAAWQRDSEFIRLANDSPVQLFSQKQRKQWRDERMEKGPRPESHQFSVRTLAEDKLIGYLGLWLNLIHSDAWVGLGIGDREFWSKGYGTDMMKIGLRFAFSELGLQRVSLGLHSYNTRAFHSYEKSGFRLEGRTRSDGLHEGQRSDTLWMGILRDEWLQMQNGVKQ